jgi:AAA+ superfamily predicted ATPase
MSDDRARFTKLLRARHGSISVVTNDEAYVMESIIGAAIDLGRKVLTWSAVRGVTAGLFQQEVEPRADTQGALKGLRQLVREDHVEVFVTLDLCSHLDDAVTLRALRELVDHCRRLRLTLVMVDNLDRLPEVISAETVRFDPKLPDDEEMATLAKDTLHRLKSENVDISVRISKPEFHALVRNLRGLTRTQAQQVVADAVVHDDTFDASDVQFVLARKRQVLRGSGLLEDVEVAVSMDEVAGIEVLKHWLEQRRSLIDGDHPTLAPPRGVLLLGVPGSGKSMCAKAIATLWKRPLMRLDAGVLYDKWVGESERRLRQALAQAEAMAPLVLWIDEIEKAFAAAASHSTDGGLSQRLFGSLLTWMQERRSAVFLVATANDIEALPAELLRKGRFDEIFFLDLPDERTRRELFRIHLGKRQQPLERFDLPALALAAEEFSGAEIEHTVTTALIECDATSTVPLDTAGVLRAIRTTTPLAITMAEQVSRLRSWALVRCRRAGGEVPAATPQAGPGVQGGAAT